MDGNSLVNAILMSQMMADQAQPAPAPQPTGLAGLATKVPPREIKQIGSQGIKDATGRLDGEPHPLDKSFRWNSKLRQYVKVNPGSLR